MRSERNNALYVSREPGAQRLDICPRTWDDWVKAGILPKPYRLGISGTTPRWLWTEVDEWISRRAGSQAPACRDAYANTRWRHFCGADPGIQGQSRMGRPAAGYPAKLLLQFRSPAVRFNGNTCP